MSGENEKQGRKRPRVILSNNYISGGEVGIRVSGVDIEAHNNTFHDVGQAWDISNTGASTVSGTRVTHSSTTAAPDRTKANQSGWTKSNGPPLPVLCPNCGNVFPSRHYNFGGQFFSLWNNEEPCPRCGNEHAILSEGMFNLALEAVEVLHAPDTTFAMIQALAQVGAEISTGAVSDEDGLKRLAGISAKFADVARKAAKLSRAAFTFICLISGPAGAYFAWKQVELATAAQQPSTHQVLDHIFKDAARIQASPESPYHYEEKQSGAPPAGEPTQGKTDAQAMPMKLLKESKPKARHLRKKARRDHRKIFGKAKHRPTSH